jgi:hypothetical protein
MQEAAGQPATASPIHEILNDLSSNLARLENGAETLNSRLTTIRPPTIDAPESNKPPAPIRGTSSVAQELSSLNERIDSLGSLVDRMVNEIEI